MPGNVLIATESFPPVNDIAALRYGAIAHRLEDSGWTPWIVTTEANGPLDVPLPDSRIFRTGPNQNQRRLQSLSERGRNANRTGILQRVRGSVRRVCRMAVDRSGFRLDAVHPGNFAWRRQTRRVQSDVLRKLPTIDLVLGSFRPPAALSIASDFARTLEVPWIAEFRDLAALRPVGVNQLAAALNRRLERRLVHSASGFVTVSPTLATLIREEYGRPTAVVFNGWQHEVEGTPTDRPWPEPYLYYAGLLYPHRMDAARLILQAMTRTTDVHFVVRSLGPADLERQILLEAGRLEILHRVHILPKALPATVEIEADHALANIVLEELDGGHVSGRGTLTGKFLKLLPQNPPVLCVARSDSDIGPILNQTNKGSLCADVAGIVQFLRAARRGDCGFHGDAARIAEYSMQNQAVKLAGFFDEITGASADASSIAA